MHTQLRQAISDIETQYVNWINSGEKIRKIESQFQINANDVKIIFYRGYMIYPLPNCPTPALVENTINVISKDERMQKIFVNSFPKDDNDCYRLSRDKYNRFELKFFSDENSFNNEIRQQEERDAPLKVSRWGVQHECCII